MNELIDQILTLSPPVALALAINIFVLFVRKIPGVPAWCLPFIALIVGGFAYPQIADVSKVSFNVKNPALFNVIIGVCIGGMSVCFNQMFKQFVERFGGKTGDTAQWPKPVTQPIDRGAPIRALLPFIALAIFATGCARFSTTQTDLSYDEKTGKPKRQIATKVTASTVFTSKSELAKFAATQTDKSQSAKVGNLKQESSGTNAVEILDRLARIAEAVSPK